MPRFMSNGNTNSNAYGAMATAVEESISELLIPFQAATDGSLPRMPSNEFFQIIRRGLVTKHLFRFVREDFRAIG